MTAWSSTCRRARARRAPMHLCRPPAYARHTSLPRRPDGYTVRLLNYNHTRRHKKRMSDGRGPTSSTCVRMNVSVPEPALGSGIRDTTPVPLATLLACTAVQHRMHCSANRRLYISLTGSRRVVGGGMHAFLECLRRCFARESEPLDALRVRDISCRGGAVRCACMQSSALRAARSLAVSAPVASRAPAVALRAATPSCPQTYTRVL